jgi:predicted Fe-Mo cluster-binding NifX family protein
MQRIAVPCEDDRICEHFGYASAFAFFDVDRASGSIADPEMRTAPARSPGALPRWLAEQGATTVLAGGIGVRAQQLCAQLGIDVLVGAGSGDPREAVAAYLSGTLPAGGNACDDGRGHGCH